jgi:hypothetical protein
VSCGDGAARFTLLQEFLSLQLKFPEAGPIAKGMNTISSALPSLSATGSGLAAISTAQQELSQDASQIANPDSPPSTQALTNLQQSSALNGAAADVIDTSNQMMGTLLNVFA